MMSDGQDKDTDEAAVHDNLLPGQKERLRAAIQILIDYLLEDGHLTQFRHESPKIKKGDQTEANIVSTPSETDLL